MVKAKIIWMQIEIRVAMNHFNRELINHFDITIHIVMT